MTARLSIPSSFMGGQNRDSIGPADPHIPPTLLLRHHHTYSPVCLRKRKCPNPEKKSARTTIETENKTKI